MRSGSRGRAGARALAALAVSLAVNAAALAALQRAGAFRVPSQRAAAIALAALAAARWDANRAVAPAASTAAPPPVAQPPTRQAPPAPEPDAGGPVIRVAPSPDQRPPARARFRADRDNDVARDVQSRDAGERDLASAVARPTRRDGVPQGIPVPGDEGRAETSASGREGAAPDGATAVARARRALAPRAAAGAPPVDPSGDGPGTRERAAPLPAEAAGEGGARRSGRYDPRLLPSASTFERLTGAPGARLPGVEEGDATSVSTRRFRYADFHLRVKESVAREWDPNRVFDARDPDASRFGRSTRGATVDIVLEASGALHEVRVVRSSGLDFYDRELVRAIRAAAPFPNPPRGLVGADGLVSLRDWRFDLAFTGTVLPPGGLTGGVRSPAAP